MGHAIPIQPSEYHFIQTQRHQNSQEVCTNTSYNGVRTLGCVQSILFVVCTNTGACTLGCVQSILLTQRWNFRHLAAEGPRCNSSRFIGEYALHKHQKVQFFGSDGTRFPSATGEWYHSLHDRSAKALSMSMPWRAYYTRQVHP